MGRRTIGLAVFALFFAVIGSAADASSAPDQTIQPADSTDVTPDDFGWDLSLFGDTLLVSNSKAGEYLDRFDSQSVYVYQQGDSHFVESQEIDESFPEFSSHHAGVVIDGEWLAVSYPWAEVSGINCGLVNVYRAVGDTWQKSQTLTPTTCEPFDSFGLHIVVEGEWLAISDARETLYLYRFDGDEWSVSESVPSGGRARAIGGGYLAALWSDSQHSSNSGMFLYELLDGGLAADPVVLHPSGEDPTTPCQDVAIENQRIYVGCPFTTHQPASIVHGAVFVFEEIAGTWAETEVLVPPNGFGDSDEFGFRVGASGDRVLVGAPGWIEDPDFPQGPGASYLFALVDGSWELSGFYPGLAAGGEEPIESGRSVELSADFLIVGDPGAGLYNGTVAVYSTPSGSFSDDENSIFQSDIDWLASEGITKGCDPPLNTEFCPDDPVTRGEMAAFLVRAMGYSDDGGGDLFVDDDGSTFENDIDKLGTAGVTRGCNPPQNDMFCPDDPVTRGEMAAFLVRAMGYSDDGGGDLFVDDDGSTFENDIDKLGIAGVTKGCNPPENTEFCPDDFVTRGQMAAFLHRALDS